eukprot:7582893-Ditylum_brightwellii.AAC.2
MTFARAVLSACHEVGVKEGVISDLRFGSFRCEVPSDCSGGFHLESASAVSAPIDPLLFPTLMLLGTINALDVMHCREAVSSIAAVLR